MYKDTVTLFNRAGTKWKVHKLTNVDLNADRAAILATYGETSSDNAKLHIKDSNGTVNGLTYVEPMSYTGANGTITFRSGENFDFFMLGEYNTAQGQAITEVDDTAYVDGFYNYLNSVRDYVFAISSVARYSVIPHFEIMGR